MPIYAYKCDACGHSKDVLQKISDAQLSECPACGASAFKKQVTAAGFQLKGSGWYVTDFKGGDKSAKPAGEAKSDSSPAADQPASSAADGKSGSSVEIAKPAAVPAPSAASAPKTDGKTPSSS